MITKKFLKKLRTEETDYLRICKERVTEQEEKIREIDECLEDLK